MGQVPLGHASAGVRPDVRFAYNFAFRMPVLASLHKFVGPQPQNRMETPLPTTQIARIVSSHVQTSASTRADRIATEIADAILAGQFAPGERLDEQRLA